MSEEWEDELVDILLESRAKADMKPYIIYGMSDKQEDAIRDIASDFGFENLRGFHMWMKAQDLEYYDIIKIKYLEG